MLDCLRLKLDIIIPTLEYLGLYSDAAVLLLLGTCAQESHLGTYVRQINGPALGIYQCEPNTHDDIWDNYLEYKTDLKEKVLAIAPRDVNNLINNLNYATAIARIHYLRVKAALPSAGNLNAIAAYYKKYYNTVAGKATESQFIANYRKYITV